MNGGGRQVYCGWRGQAGILLMEEGAVRYIVDGWGGGGRQVYCGWRGQPSWRDSPNIKHFILLIGNCGEI